MTTNDVPTPVEPDWLNADTCIENMQIAYDDATEDEDETPVDTVVSAGDLGVLIGLAEYAVRHRLAALAFVRRVADMVGDELNAHASAELRDAARAVIAAAPADDRLVDQIAARMAKADGLDWDEACGFGEDGSGNCDSSTCVAAHYEDHDADWARSQYRRYARAALGIVEPQPIRCPNAETTQRFNAGDLVSHNAGLIEAHSKRQITAVLGYDRNGGVQYRLALVGGDDQGMAYDCELDAWPGDDAPLPIPSARAALYDGKGK